jgi:hypothetical protein
MKVRMRFFIRRTILFPTRFGGLALFTLLALPVIWWAREGESFLASTERAPAAKVLVVEGWIGPEGIRAAAQEFAKGGYDLIVTSGGNPDPYDAENWQKEGWTFAEGALHTLERAGIPPEKIIAAPAAETEKSRTYNSALTVRTALAARPASLNIFTFGPHARRSRLVYEKVYGPGTKIGVIAWEPHGYTAGPWWKSSERSIDLLVQTVGFFYEFLLNSGRQA